MAAAEAGAHAAVADAYTHLGISVPNTGAVVTAGGAATTAAAAPSPQHTVMALYEYAGKSLAELTLRVGDRISVLRQVDANWCVGKV